MLRKKDLRHRVPSLVLYKQSCPKHCTDAPELQEADGWKGRTSETEILRTLLLVQQLRLRASTVRGMGSIPCQGTKIPHAVSMANVLKKKKKKKYQRIWNLAKELVEWYYDLGILGVPDIKMNVK